MGTAHIPPYVGSAILSYALVVKAVDGCYLSRLVVATDEGDAVGVADFEAEEEEECFERVEAAVDEVACGTW